jgi:hypothetical protein
MKRNPSKVKSEKSVRKNRLDSDVSIEYLKVKYKFYVLIADLLLAGISIVMRIETPVVWTFLYGIGGWAALTSNPRGIFR